MENLIKKTKCWLKTRRSYNALVSLINVEKSLNKDLQNTVQRVRESKKGFEDRLASSQAKVDNLTQEAEALRDALEVSNKELEAGHKEIEAELETAKQDLNDALSQLEGANNVNDTLQSDIADFKVKIEYLEGKVEELSAGGSDDPVYADAEDAQ